MPTIVNGLLAKCIILVLFSVSLITSVSCGPSEVNSCFTCMTSSGALNGCDPELGCGGPGGGEDPIGSDPAVPPSGTYLGTLTIVDWAGPDTTRCSHDTPSGFKLSHYIKVVPGTQPVVTERGLPCTLANSSSSSFQFTCINHQLPEVCSPASQYWDPIAGNCDAYYEKREFSIVFSTDGMHARGTVKDTRNWGGCSVRTWSLVEDWSPTN